MGWQWSVTANVNLGETGDETLLHVNCCARFVSCLDSGARATSPQLRK